MVMRPPHFGRRAGAAIAKRLHSGGEQERLGRGRDLRSIALLRALRPEGRKLRRVENAADGLAVVVLELPDLRGEIVAERRIKTKIDDVEALLAEGCRH